MATSRTDPRAPDKSSAETLRDSAASQEGDIDWLRLIGDAEDISREYKSVTLVNQLNRAYRACRNEHSTGSKYLSSFWRGRSKLFMPKTRSAIRKNSAAAAAALFGTEDAVSITAALEDDPMQAASAAVINADLNFRTAGHSEKHSIKWFLVAMGAHLDAQRTNVSCSKQYWEYREVESGAHETVLMPEYDEDGVPTGAMIEEDVPVMKVVVDKPQCQLIPIENLIIDPAAPWENPVQGGAFWSVKFPMRVDAMREMMAQTAPDGSDAGWLDVSDEVLLRGRRAETHRDTTRRTREGGADRYEDRGASLKDWDIIWVQENFVRLEGTDWHFWSVGRYGMLSKERPVEEVYPATEGERPYTLGYAQIDPHTIFSMSPVESWQPLQLEINDITNLRLDALKRSIAPLPMIKRGRNVDLNQVERRGRPDAFLMVTDHDDVKFAEVPGPNSQSYADPAQMNANFDELAGVFSTSSVQNNRQLNETVGGMRLMSGAANSVSEFDLRVWVETWVEPTLRQLMHLIRYYESDPKILKIAGSKARALDRFGYEPGLIDFDDLECYLRVNVGIGAADPMQKIAKLKASMEMLIPFVEDMKAQGIAPNYEELIEEIFGAAGFKDGRRFFNWDVEQPSGPPPELVEIMEKMKLEFEKLQVAREKMALDSQTRLAVEDKKTEREMTKEAIATHRDQANREQMVRDKGADRIAQILGGPQKGAGPAPKKTDAAQPQPENPAGQAVAQVLANAPVIEAQRQSAQAMQQVSQMAQEIAALNKQFGQMAQILARIAQQQSEPAEIVRDDTGRPIAVRKGSKIQQIVRDEDGRVTGTM